MITQYGAGIHPDDIINYKRKGEYKYKWECGINGCICNTWFVVAPQTWEDVEYVTGLECPKIIKGWMVDGHKGCGNPLLNSTDAVGMIKTPFEYRNLDYNDRYYGSYYNFQFAFGFSKSGWNKVKKSLLINGEAMRV